MLCFKVDFAYPNPEISGTYLPHPNSGGNERLSAYDQTSPRIFADVSKEDIFPLTGPKRKNIPRRQIDNEHRVNIDPKPNWMKSNKI